MLRYYSWLLVTLLFFVSALFCYTYEYYTTLILLPGISLLFLFSRKEILNPGFLLFTISFYYLLNSFYLDANAIILSKTYVCLFYFVLILFFLGFNDLKIEYKDLILLDSRYRLNRLVFCFLSFYVSYLFLLFISYFNQGLLSTFARTILISPVEAIIYGLLLIIFSKNKKIGFILFLMFMITPFIRLLASDEVNRASMLYMIILSFYLFFIYIKEEKVLRGFSSILLISLFLILLTATDIYMSFYENNIIGGDALIIFSANNIIEYYSSNNIYHEYFMPFHNYFAIAIPDDFWFLGEKLKAYNPSAWYIENILGLNPNVYPWGIGVSIIGSGYIYFGSIGVVVLSLLFVLFFNFLSNKVDSSFMLGIYLYFVFRLPYAAFRMDETFLFPVILIDLVVLCFFVLIVKKLTREVMI
ncbi:hypothetical protein A6E13_05605 [Aliivibrio fischeri]|uniref:hypothetical protein n=1 Tax=Aliivibrio fischeri TaxID=668 RepID=UPI0002D94836|nr:hypothetical protein [Aliivibrio fischeri]OCH29651.1 hypothetical protein A6E13_05605 [Aliivibrio fischeri]OEE09025.1 hypothetical protein A1Q3_11885 [Aliivibrio fischeri ZF-211]